MKIKENEWNITDKSETYNYHIIGTFITLRASKQDTQKKFYITAYISKKLRDIPKYLISLDAVVTKEEVGIKIGEICNLYELVHNANSELNDYEILMLIEEQVIKSGDRRQTRVHAKSLNNKYEMYVKKEGDTFIPKVKEVPTKKGGNLHPAVCTENEANMIVKEHMTHYDSEGWFCRKEIKNPKTIFEDELLVNEETQGILDEFLPQFGNMDVREKLLAAKKIIDELLGALGD